MISSMLPELIAFLLKRTQETGTFPRAASIRKYGITEIRRIVDFYSERKQPGEQSACLRES